MQELAKKVGGLMEIKRDLYLNELIDKKNNGFIKVITGLRRSGKSYLLNVLFKKHLKDMRSLILKLYLLLLIKWKIL